MPHIICFSTSHRNLIASILPSAAKPILVILRTLSRPCITKLPKRAPKKAGHGNISGTWTGRTHKNIKRVIYDPCRLPVPGKQLCVSKCPSGILIRRAGTMADRRRLESHNLLALIKQNMSLWLTATSVPTSELQADTCSSHLPSQPRGTQAERLYPDQKRRKKLFFSHFCRVLRGSFVYAGLHKWKWPAANAK